MIEQEWFPIPGFSVYETTRDGVVRYSMITHPEKDGSLIKLHIDENCYEGERGPFTVEWYFMNTDGANGPRAVHKSDILEWVFQQQP